MTLVELKNYISNKVVPSEFMIFVNKENSFLANQYVDAINKLAENGLNKISSIYEPQQSSLSLLTAQENTVNILKVDTFDERAEDYNQFENTIVVCEQVDKTIAKQVENYIIKFPKLEEWQILDYAKSICKNIEEQDLLWLIQSADCDIQRVTHELEKVALFDNEEQKAIFSSIRFDAQTDLFKVDLFETVNAIVEGNTTFLFDLLRHNGHDLVEPVVLANRALTSLKNILLVTQNPGISAEDCGVSAGQFRFLKYKYQSLNVDAIKQKIKFLVNFDLYLKTSRLDLSKCDMLNYLINNLCYKITL